MFRMPVFPSTPLGAHTEAAIDILGNRIRVAILGHLQEHGPSQRGEIAAALGMVPGSVSNQLTVLIEAGVVTTDPEADQIRPGARVRYVVMPQQVSNLYQALGEALGIESVPGR